MAFHPVNPIGSKWSSLQYTKNMTVKYDYVYMSSFLFMISLLYFYSLRYVMWFAAGYQSKFYKNFKMLRFDFMLTSLNFVYHQRTSSICSMYLITACIVVLICSKKTIHLKYLPSSSLTFFAKNYWLWSLLFKLILIIW